MIRDEFRPGPLGAITTPFYIARSGLCRELTELLPRCPGRVLDVGCGTKPYRDLATGATEYVGLEVDTPEARRRGGADIYYDGGGFPLDPGSFDSVLCSQVFEHVFDPDAFLSEIRRVLRPGGVLLMTVPFVWDEHEQPVDYARYSSFGLRAVLEKAGFRILEQRKTRPDVAALAQLAAGWIYKKTRRFPRLLRGVAQVCLIAPCTLLGLAGARLLPDNPDLYLDNIILARAP